MADILTIPLKAELVTLEEQILYLTRLYNSSEFLGNKFINDRLKIAEDIQMLKLELYKTEEYMEKEDAV